MNNLDLRKFQDKGYLTQDALPFTPNNVGLPAGILTQLSTETILNILSERSAEKITGSRTKVLDWADEDFYLPLIERTGQTTPYSDFGQARVAGINTNFNRHGHYRFSSRLTIGNLEEEQLSKAKINAYELKVSAVMEALEVEANRAAFEGYADNTSGQYLVYGILNNPNLPAFQASAKTIDNMDFDEIMAFFGGAVAQLTSQTGNNINPNTKIKAAISARRFAYLSSVVTTFGYSVKEAIEKAFPNIEFVSVFEFESANNGQDVIYFIGESFAGGTEKTLDLGFSELFRQSNIVLGEEFRSQQISSGVVGAILYKPTFIVRYTNI